jgi:hypothetical protein
MKIEHKSKFIVALIILLKAISSNYHKMRTHLKVSSIVFSAKSNRKPYKKKGFVCQVDICTCTTNVSGCMKKTFELSSFNSIWLTLIPSVCIYLYEREKERERTHQQPNRNEVIYLT